MKTLVRLPVGRILRALLALIIVGFIAVSVFNLMGRSIFPTGGFPTNNEEQLGRLEYEQSFFMPVLFLP